jgi:hypothetical protein
MEQSPSWQDNRSLATQKFPAFCVARMFITAFIRDGHLYTSTVWSIPSMLFNPSSQCFILILPSHLRLGLSTALLHSRVPTNPACTSTNPHSCYIPCPYLIYFILIFSFIISPCILTLCNTQLVITACAYRMFNIYSSMVRALFILLQWSTW